MKISDKATWEALKAETEPRAAAIVDFAERWANKMEEILAEGFPVRQAMNVAYKETNHPENLLGITDSAALILRDCWVHGHAFFKAYARETGQTKLAKKINRQDETKQPRRGRKRK